MGFYLNKEMTTALMLASLSGNVDCIETLLNFGAFTECRRKTGATALFIASQCGNYDAVELLVSRGAAIASQNGHADILQLLLQKYADVNIRRDDGTSPLWI